MQVDDPLQTIVTNVPDWLSRLDNLKNQIAQRQIELAQLTESERPPTTRSLRNKGSTESLRPKDQHENPFLTQEEAGEKEPEHNPFTTPVKEQGAFTDASPIVVDSPVLSPEPPKVSQSNGASSPRTSPTRLAPRNVEQLQAQAAKRLAALPQNGTSPGMSPPIPQAALPLLHTGLQNRKRKGSMGSDDTAIQKYRTRSMIIVYYDSAVQIAFEELVRFVSSARNGMRKQKMANRMAEMRRMAELEAEREEATSKHAGNDEIMAADLDEVEADDDDDDDLPPPILNFVSTRRMGPGMDGSRPGMTPNSTRGLPTLMGHFNPSVRDNKPSIFDDLDKDLEFCQSTCEHAAHQFLRDGECNEEIESIKRRLIEVRESSVKHIKTLEEERAAAGPAREEGPSTRGTAVPSRAYRSTNVRKDINPGPVGLSATPGLTASASKIAAAPAAFDADSDIEVDDDDDDDDDAAALPPKLIFKSARSYVH